MTTMLAQKSKCFARVQDLEERVAGKNSRQINDFSLKKADENWVSGQTCFRLWSTRRRWGLKAPGSWLSSRRQTLGTPEESFDRNGSRERTRSFRWICKSHWRFPQRSEVKRSLESSWSKLYNVVVPSELKFWQRCRDAGPTNQDHPETEHTGHTCHLLNKTHPTVEWTARISCSEIKYWGQN